MANSKAQAIITHGLTVWGYGIGIGALGLCAWIGVSCLGAAMRQADRLTAILATLAGLMLIGVGIGVIWHMWRAYSAYRQQQRRLRIWRAIGGIGAINDIAIHLYDRAMYLQRQGDLALTASAHSDLRIRYTVWYDAACIGALVTAPSQIMQLLTASYPDTASDAYIAARDAVGAYLDHQYR